LANVPTWSFNRNAVLHIVTLIMEGPLPPLPISEASRLGHVCCIDINVAIDQARSLEDSRSRHVAITEGPLHSKLFDLYLASYSYLSPCMFVMPYYRRAQFSRQNGRKKDDIKKFHIYFFLWRCDPTRVMASSFLMFLDHTQRRITVGRTPLDE